MLEHWGTSLSEHYSTHIHTHLHARMHARTHARTHARMHTHSAPPVESLWLYSHSLGKSINHLQNTVSQSVNQSSRVHLFVSQSVTKTTRRQNPLYYTTDSGVGSYMCSCQFPLPLCPSDSIVCIIHNRKRCEVLHVYVHVCTWACMMSLLHSWGVIDIRIYIYI